jgi:hypothetical protein
MVRKVVVIGGRAYIPKTGVAVGYRPGETAEEGVPTVGVTEQQWQPLTPEQIRETQKQQRELKKEAEEKVEPEPTELKREAEEKVPPPKPPPKPPTVRERIYGYVGAAERFVVPERIPVVRGLVGFPFLVTKTAIAPRIAAKEVAEQMRIGVKMPMEIALGQEYPKEERIAAVKHLGSVAAEMAATAVTGYGFYKGVRYLRTPKIKGIKVRAVAVERMKSPRAVEYKVAAKPKVILKKPLRKPYVKELEVTGVAAAKKITPKVWEARAMYAARLPKKPVTAIAKVRGLMKIKAPRLMEEVAAAKVFPYPKLKPIKKVVTAAYQYKYTVTPKGELYLTYGKTYPLPKVKPYIEKGITIVKRTVRKEPSFVIKYKPVKGVPKGGEITSAPRPIVKPSPPPMVTLGIKEITKVVFAPPKPIKYYPMYPITKPRVKPSVIPKVAKRVMVTPMEKVGVKLRRKVKQRARVMERLGVKVKVKQRVREKTLSMVMVTPKMMVRPRLKKVVSLPISPKVPITVRGGFPLGLGLPEFERPTKKVRKPFKIPEYKLRRYQPSLIGIEFRVRGKPISAVSTLGIRPIPKGIKKWKWEINNPFWRVKL